MASSDEKGVSDIVSPQEENLALELKKCCTIFGKEQMDKLSKTASALFRLGRLYRIKASKADGMLRKLTLLRACALVNGAKVRYRLTNDSQGTYEANKELALLCENTMQFADSVKQDFDLMKTSEVFMCRVQQMRQLCSSLLCSAPDIVQSDSSDDPWPSRRQKVEYIWKLNETVTEEYILIMRAISQKVVEVLGSPKCRFAVAGLGSLARKEITPYSDFEHVIILEDGVQEREDYEAVKEYFRWYAVCFQMIVINFGETFIRSVGVKSLNDLYTNEEGQNWFYDIYTPCGIAFDGMVPHSCNNPLGRQETTKLRSHVVELIQPISEMIKLINHKNALKNGYYLNELLTRTCFVDGDEEIHKTFQEQVTQAIEAEDLEVLAETLLKTIEGNHNQDVSSLTPVGRSYFNVKSKMYRPNNVLISCIGRVWKLPGASSLETVKQLLEKNIIDKKFADEVSFAVAVVCDFRLRQYATAENQRYEVETKSTIRSFGFDNYSMLRITIVKLRLLAKYSIACCSDGNMTYAWETTLSYIEYINLDVVTANAMYDVGMFNEVVEIAEKNIDNEEASEDDVDRLVQLLQLAYIGKILDPDVEFGDPERCLKNVEDILDLPKVSEIAKAELLEVAVSVCIEANLQKGLDRNLGYCEDGIRRLESLDASVRVRRTEKGLYRWKAFILMWMKRYEEALMICHTLLDGIKGDEILHNTNWRNQMIMMKALSKMGRIPELESMLQEIRKTIRRASGKSIFNEYELIDILGDMMELECDSGLYTGVIATQEIFNATIRETDIQFDRSYRTYLRRNGIFLSTAYLKLDRFEECIDICQKNIYQIKKVNKTRQVRKIRVHRDMLNRMALAHTMLGFRSSLKDRINHMLQAVEVFQYTPHSKYFEIAGFYRPLVTELVWRLHILPRSAKHEENLKSFNLCREILRKCPTCIRRKHDRMQFPALAFSLRVIGEIHSQLEIDHSVSNVLSLLTDSCTFLWYQTTHPFVYLTLNRVLRKYFERSGDQAMLCEMDRITHCFVERYCKPAYSQCFDKAVHLLANYDLLQASQSVWKQLVQMTERSDECSILINFILSIIVFKIDSPVPSKATFLNDCICISGY